SASRRGRWHRDSGDVGLERLGLAGDSHGRGGYECDRRADATARLFGDEDGHPLQLREPLDARGDVHRVADRGVLAPAWRPDVAEHDSARVNPDTHAEWRFAVSGTLAVEFVEGPLHRQRAAYGPLGVIRLRDGRPEVHHQPVAQVL